MPLTDQRMTIPQRRPAGPIVAGVLIVALAVGLAAGACFMLALPFRAGSLTAVAPTSPALHASRRDKRSATHPPIGGVSRTADTSPHSRQGAADTHSAQKPVRALVTRTRVTRERLVVRGHGSIESLVKAGSPGLRRVTISSISHRVVRTVVLKVAVPTVVRRREPAGGKLVALTFDDGPHPTQTPKILKILQAEHVKATFFMVGKMARYHPQAARAVAQAGMLIGDHTEDHKLLPTMTEPQIRSEIAWGQASIRAITGVTTHWFRSP